MDHNKRESQSRARLLTGEIRGLKILSRQSEPFKQRLAAIWGTDKFQYTAVPLDLIASNFLDHAAELPVYRKANPKWAAILAITDEKMEALVACLYLVAAGSWSRRFLPSGVTESVVTGPLGCGVGV